MKDFCGIRTGENNLCRRSELMGQYGRAALSVAPTPQTFSHIQPQPQRINRIHTTNKRVPFTKHHSSSHKPHVSHRQKVFAELFPQKSGFFAKLFYIKKRTYSHRQSTIFKTAYTKHGTIQYKTIIARSGVYYATSLSRLFAFNIRNGNTI